MINASGITPLFDRILIKPLEVEEKTASGIIISTAETSERRSEERRVGKECRL